MALCKAVMSVKSTLDNPGPLCAVVAAGTVLPPLPNRNEIPPSTHVGVPPVLCRTCPLVPIGRRAKFLAPAAYIMSPAAYRIFNDWSEALREASSPEHRDSEE